MRSPPRRAPLFETPIATPLQACKAAAPKGPTFCFLNYNALYLGAMRARHDEPSARSPSFALLEKPGLEALLSVPEENSEMGRMRGPEIRVEWHEARCHEAPGRGS